MKNNSSFFSPNRLVFKGGADVPKGNEAPAGAPKVQLSEDAQNMLINQAKEQLDAMALDPKADPKKTAQLRDLYNKALEEWGGSDTARKEATKLYSFLTESAPAKKPAVAKKKVQEKPERQAARAERVKKPHEIARERTIDKNETIRAYQRALAAKRTGVGKPFYYTAKSGNRYIVRTERSGRFSVLPDQVVKLDETRVEGGGSEA